MSDLIEKKKKRLEELKREQAEKRRKRIKRDEKPAAPREGGVGKDIEEILNDAAKNSAFDERKQKEEEEQQPKIQKPINTSLSVAVDQ